MNMIDQRPQSTRFFLLLKVFQLGRFLHWRIWFDLRFISNGAAKTSKATPNENHSTVVCKWRKSTTSTFESLTFDFIRSIMICIQYSKMYETSAQQVRIVNCAYRCIGQADRKSGASTNKTAAQFVFLITTYPFST